MDALYFLLAPGAVIAGLTLFGAWRRARWASALATVAKELGLQYARSRRFGRARAHGRVENNSVTLELITVGSGRNQHLEMRLRVGGIKGLGGLELARENVLRSLAKAVTGDDVQLGEQAFDRAVYVAAGSEDNAISWLDATARAAAMRAVAEHGATLEGGSIELQTRNIATSPEALRDRIGAMLELARALRMQPKRLPARLFRNAVQDPEPHVRARNLRALLAKHPNTDEARSAIAACAADPSPRVRVIAVAAQGDAGLRDLVELACDATLGRTERIEACARVGARFLSSPLAQPRAAEAERLLVSCLDGDPAAVESAANALASFASIGAVEALQRHAKTLLGGPSKDAARAAIAAIQARAGGEGGRLSVVSAAAGEGALSEAEEEGGTLALVPDEESRRGS